MAAAQQQRAITLGEANATVLDLTDPHNQKHYRNGMIPLEGDKYDGDSRGLLVFLEALKAKAIMYHWFNVLTVPDAQGNQLNFLLQYGLCTYDECRAWAEIFMAARDRAAKNSQMMLHCLVDSITTRFIAELMAESDKYIVDGYMEGLCFLKLLISKAQVDTIATVNVLRNSIGRLPSKMVKLSGNITEFNSYVKNIELFLMVNKVMN
jgi:hypothetical protein